MGKGLGILTEAGYAYKIVSPAETLLTPGIMDFSGFKGVDAYETWLAAGNTGTIEEFLADLGGLVVNDVRATFNLDKLGAEVASFYTGDDLTQTTYTVLGVVKYTVTYSNNLDGSLDYKLVTRIDGKWFKDTYEYDVDGVVQRVIPTDG